MNTFTASNGMTVERDHRGEIQINGFAFMAEGAELAIHEFFRAEEDTRLGRWRFPEDPDFVVYPEKPSGRSVRVFRESTAQAMRFNPKDHIRSQPSQFGAAAQAYLDAHPEPKPEWHDAKPWETWLITFAGVEQAVTLDEDREFRDRRYKTEESWAHISSEEITAGRRIWPEDVS